ncbi:hypothetical protein SAMN05421882_102336 [Nitrosomonas communis]|uniref:Uncharacterized protein n=1 Tax=Nitrosomonas communis TaxID=44574 RepID=A0A1H2VQA1_9PROT|nr:hypothetical protein SAMN05421882_102336 [Nitrosomonas communis]
MLNLIFILQGLLNTLPIVPTALEINRTRDQQYDLGV